MCPGKLAITERTVPSSNILDARKPSRGCPIVALRYWAVVVLVMVLRVTQTNSHNSLKRRVYFPGYLVGTLSMLSRSMVSLPKVC